MVQVHDAFAVKLEYGQLPTAWCRAMRSCTLRSAPARGSGLTSVASSTTSVRNPARPR